jgi:hypothetical protein
MLFSSEPGGTSASGAVAPTSAGASSARGPRAKASWTPQGCPQSRGSGSSDGASAPAPLVSSGLSADSSAVSGNFFCMYLVQCFLSSLSYVLLEGGQHGRRMSATLSEGIENGWTEGERFVEWRRVWSPGVATDGACLRQFVRR